MNQDTYQDDLAQNGKFYRSAYRYASQTNATRVVHDNWLDLCQQYADNWNRDLENDLGLRHINVFRFCNPAVYGDDTKPVFEDQTNQTVIRWENKP